MSSEKKRSKKTAKSKNFGKLYSFGNGLIKFTKELIPIKKKNFWIQKNTMYWVFIELKK
jgi:hypothetical protein